MLGVGAGLEIARQMHLIRAFSANRDVLRHIDVDVKCLLLLFVGLKRRDTEVLDVSRGNIVA